MSVFRLLIGQLLEFILGLEKDYPSTVSTITRTCTKLVPKDKPVGTCSLCQRYALSAACVLHIVLIDADHCRAGWTNGSPKYRYGR